MDDENQVIGPEDDPRFAVKGAAFTVFWTLLILLTAYAQYG